MLELYIWSGNFGLSTWHPECLSLHTYAALCGAPVNIRSTDNPFWQTIPAFIHKGTRLHSLEEVVSYLERNCGFHLDRQLSPQERSEVCAFRILLRDKIAPYVAFTMMAHEENFNEVLRPWLGAKLPFPLGLYYIRKLRETSIALCEASVGTAITNEVHMTGGHAGEQLMESVLFTQAFDAIDALAQKMGYNFFLLGKRPSSVDALLFAYLAPMLRLPLPKNRLKGHIESHANLVQFVDRISKSYFPRVTQVSKSKEAEKMSEVAATSRSNNILAGLIAVSAMAGYAYFTGLYRAIPNVVVHIED